MKDYLYFMMLAFVAWTCCASCSDDDEERAVQWQLNEAMSDDFNSWNPEKWGTDVWVTSSVYAFRDENVSVADGCLRLAVKKEEHNGFHYTAARVKSAFNIGGNTAVEVRAKLVKHAAHVANAIWLSDQPLPWSNPNLEIDLVETMPDDTWPDWKFSSGILYWWLKAEGVA